MKLACSRRPKPSAIVINSLLAMVAAISPASATSPHAAPGQPHVRLVGPDEVVIPAEVFTCSRSESPTDGSLALDVPDAPPRLIRREDGQFELIAAHHNNIPFYSTDGVRFTRRNCNSVLPSRQDPDPSHFADQDWITGLITTNGRDVYALVHDEYHGPAHIPRCKARLKPGQNYWAPVCLSVNMVGFVSHDQGTTFAPLPGDLHIAAATPVRLNTETTSVGIRDSSNVIRNPKDGYYYFVAHAMPSPPQSGGTCLFRAHDPFTQPWIAWNGSGFDTRLGSPYQEDNLSARTCTPVLDNTYYVASINYNTKLKKFLAVARRSDHTLVAITSTDLVHWDAPEVLRTSIADNWWKPGQSNPDPDSYYSIIDPSSTSPSFDTSGDSPYLYFVRWRTTPQKVLNHQRDIVRTRIEITP